MRKGIPAIIICLAACLVCGCFCCGALAEDYPVNPYQEKVLEMDRISNSRGGSYIRTGISVSTLQEPSLDSNLEDESRTGIWKIEINREAMENNYGDIGEITDRYIAIQSVDPGSGYSNEYLFQVLPDLEEDESCIIESCLFVAPGNYRLVVYYDFSGFENDDRYAGFCVQEVFTVDDDGEHPDVQTKVEEVLGLCRVEGDDWQTALNIHDWLTHNAYYDYSYSFYGAEDVLLRGYGVCESYSKAFWYLMDEANIECELATSRTHAWNVIVFDNDWYHVDVTWDDPGNATIPVSGRENREFFCINDELIYGFMDQSYSHSNRATVMGRCNSLAASYPMHTGEWQNCGAYLDDHFVRHSYLDLMREGANGTENPFTIQANHYFPVGQGNSYYYAYQQPALYDRYFLAYGLSQGGLTLEDGRVIEVEVTFDTEDMFFTVNVLGGNTGDEWVTDYATWRLSETEVLPGMPFTAEVTYTERTLDEIILAISQGNRMVTYSGEGNEISGTFEAGNSQEEVIINCYGYYTEDGTRKAANHDTYDGPLTILQGEAAPIPTITVTSGQTVATDGEITFRIASEEPAGSGDYSDVWYEVAATAAGASGSVTVIGNYPADGTECTITTTQIQQAGFYIAEGISLQLQVRAYGPGYESETATSGTILVTDEPAAEWAPILPESIIPGADAEIIIPAGMEEADGYDIWVEGPSGGNEYRITAQAPGTYVIPAMVFADGCSDNSSYVIHVWTYQFNGERNEELDWTYLMYYSVETYEGTQSLTITPEEYEAGQPLIIGLSVTDADQVIVQEQAVNSYGYLYWNTLTVTDNPGVSVNVTLPEGENHTIRAAVKKDGVWSAWSNIAEAAPVIGGICNDDISWTLNSEGKLTISGTGEIPEEKAEPWDAAYADQVTEVVIEEGITGIGDWVFAGHDNLVTVTIPASLTAIGDYAFAGCGSLTDIMTADADTTEWTRCYDGELRTFSLPDTVETLGTGVFIDASFGETTELTPDFILPQGTDYIGEEAFCGIAATHVLVTSWNAEAFRIDDYAFGNCEPLRYFQVDVWGPDMRWIIADHAFDGCSTELVFIGIENDALKQFAVSHGFTYLENEMIGGNG